MPRYIASRKRDFALVMIALSCAITAMVPTPIAAQLYSDSYTFLKAVRDGDGDVATELINDDTSRVINTRDRDSGETALMIVIKRRDEAWTRFLLSKDANPKLADKDGYTALMHAAVVGFVDGAEILLKRGAKINNANNRGETALIIAVQNKNMAMIRLLMQKGANPDITDHIAGSSARDYAQRYDRSGVILDIIDSETEKSPQANKPVFGPH